MHDNSDLSDGPAQPRFTPKQLVRSDLDRAVGVQAGVVRAHVARMRRSRPDATPAEIVTILEKQFVAAVATLGGAAGASAAVPGVGTGVAVAVNIAEVGSYLEAATLFTLAVADVHGVRVDEIERRRTLLMAVLLGSNGAATVERIAGRTGKYWAKQLVKSVPMTAVDAVNKVLGPRFVTKFGTQQGILVLGREVPFGIGAAIGAGGNAALAVVANKGARRVFGPAPEQWAAGDGSDEPDDRAAPEDE